MQSFQQSVNSTKTIDATYLKKKILEKYTPLMRNEKLTNIPIKSKADLLKNSPKVTFNKLFYYCKKCIEENKKPFMYYSDQFEFCHKNNCMVGITNTNICTNVHEIINYNFNKGNTSTIIYIFTEIIKTLPRSNKYYLMPKILPEKIIGGEINSLISPDFNKRYYLPISINNYEYNDMFNSSALEKSFLLAFTMEIIYEKKLHVVLIFIPNVLFFNDFTQKKIFNAVSFKKSSNKDEWKIIDFKNYI